MNLRVLGACLLAVPVLAILIVDAFTRGIKETLKSLATFVMVMAVVACGIAGFVLLTY
jgi:hypothetical protein